MDHTVRATAKSKVLRPFSLHRPFSCFSFVDKHFGFSATPIRRLMSQSRLHSAQTLIVEVPALSKDIQEEDEDIKKRFPRFRYSKVFRLSFFQKSFDRICSLRRIRQTDFLGYAVLKCEKIGDKFTPWRIYESVLRPSRHDNNYYRGDQEWVCVIAGHKFSVRGYLYAQQNDMTNVCAHVAVRTAAARFHPKGDLTYREMNKLLGIDHVVRKAGGNDGDGLGVTEMVKLLNAAGATCFSADYTENQTAQSKAPFQKFIYGSIESGFPAIIVFRCASGDRHAIPIFGHTFNNDTWVQRADSSYFRIGQGTKYIPSESWVSMYIGHDDNWGSNYCIPRRYLHTRRECNYPQGENEGFCDKQSECVSCVIATFPKTVQISPIKAEALGGACLFSILRVTQPKQDCSELPWSNVWFKRLKDYSVLHQLVLRPLLIRASDYALHLSKIRDWDREKLNSSVLNRLREWNSQEWIWMIELSVPELFSANKRKIEEVLIKAEQPLHPIDIFSSFILARVPGYFVTRDSTSQAYDYWPSGAEGHVELYGCEE